MPGKSQSIQITIVGEEGVGKASFIKRMALDNYQHEQHHTDELYSETKANLKFIKLPAQQCHAPFRTSFYPLSQICILLFSLDNPASFEAIKHYHQEIKQKNPKARLILVGNKADKTQAVKSESIGPYASEHGLSYFEISIRTKLGLAALNDHISSLVPEIQTQTTMKRQTLSAFRHSMGANHTASSNRQREINNRYQKFWSSQPTKPSLDPNLQNIRHLLANYCAYIPPSCFSFFPSSFISKAYLILTGHWRHHVDGVRQIVTDIDNKTLSTNESVISKLDELRTGALKQNRFNRQGSLSLRLSFIKSKCSTDRTSYPDEDAHCFRSHSCCAI